jgi:hypothetical protein
MEFQISTVKFCPSNGNICLVGGIQLIYLFDLSGGLNHNL